MILSQNIFDKRLKLSTFLALIALFLSGLIFWRLEFNFFYWDEWSWLSQMSQNNYSLLQPHNEHFLPIIKFLYESIFSVFGNNYLVFIIINIFLHTLTASSLYLLINNLFKRRTFAFIGLIIFFYNGLHWENIFWGFQSQIILTTFFTIWAVIYAQKFVQSKANWHLATCILLSFLAYFCFGLGILAAIFSFTYISISLILSKFDKQIFLKSLSLFIVFFFQFTFALIYTRSETQFQIIASSGLINSLKSMVLYFINSIFFLPSRFFFHFGFGSSYYFSLPIFSLILFCSAVFISSVKKNSRLLKNFILGLCFFLIPISLLAISRYKEGVFQGLSDRYAYVYLTGFTILFISISAFVLNHSILSHYLNRNFKYFITFSFVFIYIFISFNFVRNREVETTLRNATNYVELYKLSSIDGYQPNLLRLHPRFSQDEFKRTFEKLNLRNEETFFKSLQIMQRFSL